MNHGNGKAKVIPVNVTKHTAADAAGVTAEASARVSTEASSAVGAEVEQNLRPVEFEVIAPAELSEVEKLRAERDSLVDRLARLQAEFENARKRTQREQQEFRDYAQTAMLQSFLPVLDSFERALDPAHADPVEFRSGVELIHRQLNDALAKAGLVTFTAQGEPFDPRLHEAIEMVETNEVPDQHILEELQRGYMLKDRLLRPAMVRVGKSK